MPEFAEAVGVSQRLLEIVFKERLGITQKRFSQYCRLGSARRELLNPGEKDFLTVTKAASRSGFSEMGRFAVEYKKLFGESPSQTLMTNAGVSPVTYADIVLG